MVAREGISHWWGYGVLAAIAAAALAVSVAAHGSGRFVASARVSGDETGATLRVEFNCKVGHVAHAPQSQGDLIRVQLEPTSICNGVAPTAAASRILLRPAGSDLARLMDLEYDGNTATGPVLVLRFNESVTFSIVDEESVEFGLDIRIGFEPDGQATDEPKDVLHRQVIRDFPPKVPYVINLASHRRIPTLADTQGVATPKGRRIYYSETLIDGVTWYRMRLGDFDSVEAARAAMDGLGSGFSDAWIDQHEAGPADVELIRAESVASQQPSGNGDEVDRLMEEARREIIAGNSSRAVQIYTKILQAPPHPRHPEAQEFLALAREKQGQLAHAKAEYQRYLSLYPNSDGATRVGQRLAALLAGNGRADSAPGPGTGVAADRRGLLDDWRIQTYFAQYYRRDVNQPDEQDDIVSQSALYSDVSIDARRRGERFDVSSRLTAGYRADFLDEDRGSGNETRVSYAYVDVADVVTKLRGRLGRQSRNTGGVLGRFDGLNLGYQATERVLLNTVFGRPAYSASDGLDSERLFYGVSASYGPLWDGLELGIYYIEQRIEGIDDRQAIGGEFRYFGDNQSVWGVIDYDTLYNELGYAFLQTSWRIGSKLSLHGSADRRRSPFLSTGNALIGQPVESFAELAQIFSATELFELGLDRSPISTTYSLGFAHSLTPNLQINADYNRSNIDATPDSGGVFGSPAATYSYLSASLVASGLFREGDVLIVGARYADSDTARVMTLTLDGRFPVGKLRINPRLRVDRRERLNEADYEWIYSPGIRMQYRPSRKVRIELEAGKQFAQRDSELANLDRESYYVSLGYQAFF